MDQDYSLITRMRVLNNVYRAVTHMRSLTGDAINTHLSASERIILGEVQRMGIPLGGLRRV